MSKSRVAIVLGLLLASAGGAQVDPNFDRGFDPERAYQVGELDQVNLQNGVLAIHLPIGGQYPVGGGLSYGFTLSYSSAIWESKPIVGGGGAVRMYPNQLFNSGVGWSVNPGVLVSPSDPENLTGRWIYVSPDQGSHEFWDELHRLTDCSEPSDCDDGDSTGLFGYSRDGSYLRLRRNAQTSPVTHALDFPDGTIHRFRADPNRTTRFRLIEMKNHFAGNSVTVGYTGDGAGQTTRTWTFTDPHQRSQVVHLKKVPYDNGLAPHYPNPDPLDSTFVVDRIVLTAFQGSSPTPVTAEYDFQYVGEDTTWFSLRRDCKDVSGVQGLPFQAPVLSAIVLPDGTRWQMTTWNDTTDGLCRRGQIHDLIYPTGGRAVYDYNRVTMPPTDSCWIQDDLSVRNTVLAEKRYQDNVGPNPEGIWYYGYQLLQTTNPSPSPCEFGPADQWADELRVRVTTPLNDYTDHYFSVWPFFEASPAPVHRRVDYGLPISRVAPITDPVTGDRYLSSETYDCSTTPCTKIQSEWLLFDTDGPDTSSPLQLSEAMQRNRRVIGKRTLYHSDLVGGVPRFADSRMYNFDGLGNFRSVETTGNFRGENSRKVFTDFNDDVGEWGTSSYQMLSASSAWILGTFDEVTTTEPADSATEKWTSRYEFNAANGALQCARRLAAQPQFSASDLLTVYGYDTGGNLLSESFYGGDQTDAGTGSICAIDDGPEYILDHTYEDGVRDTTQYDGTSFLTLDLEIDGPSGLVWKSKDTAGMETIYDYDTMGRLKTIKPQKQTSPQTIDEDAWTKITYVTSTTPFRIETNRCPVNDTTCFNSAAVSREETTLDGRGRLWRQRRLREVSDDSAWSRKVRFYDAAGNVLRESSWWDEATSPLPGSEATVPATSFLDTTVVPNRSSYDPYGRPRRKTLADGSVETFGYLGVGWASSTRKVATTLSPSAAQEESVTRWSEFDRQGRLRRVEENSRPDGSVSGTEYEYDGEGRLTHVCGAMVSGNCTQERWFDYDQRGLLLSETHPEKGGTGGNGSVLYGQYDSRGHAWFREDGAASRQLFFEFDSAERLLSIRDDENFFHKVFQYDSGLGAGNGKLYRAVRHQRISPFKPTSPIYTIEEIYEYLSRGGRPSARQTVLKNNFVETKRWKLETFWNVLGGLGETYYPRCVLPSGTPCAGITGELLDMRNFLTNGYVTSIQEMSPTPRTWATISYRPNFLVGTTQHLNGMVETTTMTADGMPRPGSIAVTGVSNGWSSGTYAYDGSGNIKWMGASTSTRDEYRYDRVSRLREANLKSFSPVKNQKYDFDAYGNLVRVTTGMTVENYRVCTNGPTQPHEYCQNQSPTNRLLDGAYDEAGNLIQWGNLKYDFDLLNTLLYTPSGGGAGWDFIYNADDERVLAFQPGGTQTIWTLRDLQGQVLRRVATDVGVQYTTSIQTDYIRRGTLLLGAITTSEGGPIEWLSEPTSFGTGTTRHFALDHLGSVRLISSATGTTIGKHTYYPFGREATPSLDTEPMKFANHERDGFETGFDLADDLDYMHARYYSPLTSRFLSVDPVGGNQARPSSWNRYAYVLGNPMAYSDPTGEITAAQIARSGEEVVNGVEGEIENSIGKPAWTVVKAVWPLATLTHVVLDTFKMGDATGTAIGSDAGAGETALAVGLDALRAGALVAPLAGAGRAVVAGVGARTTTGVVATKDGLVYVRSTIDRIKSGERFPHRNDGSVFGNREGLLPNRPHGYYREYVHPTPGVRGPGSQRVVQGQKGELYYTPDHYQTFVPLN